MSHSDEDEEERLRREEELKRQQEEEERKRKNKQQTEPKSEVKWKSSVKKSALVSPRVDDETLKKTKSEIRELKAQVQANVQAQKNNPKVVYTYLNAEMAGDDVKKVQSQLLTSSMIASQSGQKLAPLSRNLKMGVFKSVDDIQMAQQLFKETPLIGIALQRKKNEKYQQLINTFNEITNQEYDRCLSHLSFEAIDKQVQKNNQYLIVSIIDTKVTNFKDLRIGNKLELKQPVNPAHFYWDVTHNKKPLALTGVKPIEDISRECLEFVFVNNYLDPIECSLYKKQAGKAQLVGSFSIATKEFEEFEQVMKVGKKNVKKKQPTKTLLTRPKDQQPLQGKIEIQYQLIQYAEKIEPQNTISNVMGSPRSIEERKRRKLVENSKEGDQQYEWRPDQTNLEKITIIEEAHGDIVIISEEKRQQIDDLLAEKESQESGFQNLLSDNASKYPNSYPPSTRFVAIRVKKEQMTPEVMNLINSLKDDPNKTVFGDLKRTLTSGRVKKEVFNQALQSLGMNATTALLTVKDDLGQSLMDVIFDDCDYGQALDIIPELELHKKENQIELMDLTDKLLKGVKDQVKREKRLETTVRFLKVLKELPESKLIAISMIEKFELEPTNFVECLNINNNNMWVMDNYEHVMLLGKMLKLVKVVEDQNTKFKTFEDNLQEAYDKAKSGIYFTVPVLPKKMKIAEKRHLLVLGEESKKQYKQTGNRKAFGSLLQKSQMDEKAEPRCLYNVFHEMSRRKRWNMFYRGYKAAPEFFYQQNTAGYSPIQQLIEEAPFEIIMSLLTDFGTEPKEEVTEDQPPQDGDNEEQPQGEEPEFQAEENRPPKEAEEITPPRKAEKLNFERLVTTKANNGRNIIHSLLLNNNPLPQAQLQCLKKLQELLEPEDFKNLISEVLTDIDITPLSLYINRLSSNEDQIGMLNQEYIKEILSILIQPVVQDWNIPLILADGLLTANDSKIDSITDQYVNYTLNHIQVARAMAQLQPSTFELVSSQIPWIDWLSLNKTSTTNRSTQYAINNLARQGKYDLIEKILKQFQKNRGSLVNPLLPIEGIFNHSCFMLEKIVYQNDEEYIELDKEGQKVSQILQRYPVHMLISLLENMENHPIKQFIKTFAKQLIKECPFIVAESFNLDQVQGKFKYERSLFARAEKQLGSLESTLEPLQYQEYLDNQYKQELAAIEQKQYKIKQPPNEDGEVVEEEISHQAALKAVQLLISKGKIDAVFDYLNITPVAQNIAQDPDAEIQQENQQSKSDFEALRKDTTKLRKVIAKRLFQELTKKDYGGVKIPKYMMLLKKNKELVSERILHPALMAALSNKDLPLLNNILLLKSNPAFIDAKIVGQSILPLPPNYQKAFTSHFALALDRSQFTKLLEQTKGILTADDYTGMIAVTAKNGMYDRLAQVIGKNKKADIIASVLRDTLCLALRQWDGKKRPIGKNNHTLIKKLHSVAVEEFTDPIPQQNIKPQTYPKFQRAYQVVPKQVPIINTWAMTDPGAVTSLLAQAQKLFETQNGYPKNFERHNYLSQKAAYKVAYDQLLRRTFLTQKPACAFNNWAPSEQQNFEKTIETLVNNLNIGEAITNKKVPLVLKKAYILPLFTANTAAIEATPNQLVAKLKAVDLLVQFHLQQKPTKQDLEKQQTRQSRSLNFIAKNFTSEIASIFKETRCKPKILRILRAIDYTFKKSQSEQAKYFAVQVAIIINQNFAIADFKDIVEKNSDQVFNAMAVAMMRSKTVIPQALEFMAKQLSSQSFYDLVFVIEEVAGDRKPLTVKSLPVSLEIAEAIVLTTPSKNNAEYFLTLLKAKIKPFFKSYTIKPIQPFGEEQKVKKLPLFDYLVYQSHEQLLKKYYIKTFKKSNNERRLVYLALSSGNVSILEMILKALNWNKQAFLTYMLEFPVLKLIVERFSEDDCIKLLEYVKDCSFDEIRQVLQLERENNVMQSIIKKRYGDYYYFLCQTFKDKPFYKQLKTFIVNFKAPFLTAIDIDDDDLPEDEDGAEAQPKQKPEPFEMTILEYSLSQRFPDIAFHTSGLILIRPVFGDKQGQLIMNQQQSFHQCGFDLPFKDKYNLKQKEFKLYKAMETQLQNTKGRISGYICLLSFMIEYCNEDLQVKSIIEALFKLAHEPDQWIKELANKDYQYFNQLQIYDHGAILLLHYYYKLGKIVDPFEFSEMNNNRYFWATKEFCEILLQFGIDLKKGYKQQIASLDTLTSDDWERILPKRPKQVLEFIKLNQLSLLSQQNENFESPFERSEELILSIRNQFIDGKVDDVITNLIDYVKHLKEHNCDCSQQLMGLLAILIADFNGTNDQIVKEFQYPEEVHPLISLITDNSNEITGSRLNILIQALKNHRYYGKLAKRPLKKKHILGIPFEKEKDFIQGLIMYLKQKINSDDNFTLTLNDKQLESSMNFQLQKIDPLQADKIYRGLQTTKFIIDLVSEFELLVKDFKEAVVNSEILWKLSCDVNIYTGRDASKQSVELVKVTRNKDQEFLFQVKLPLIQFEFNAYASVQVPSNAAQQLAAIVQKSYFEQVELQELIKTASEVSKVIANSTISQVLDKTNITYEHVQLLNTLSKEMFYFGNGIQQYADLKSQLTADNFTDEKSNLVKRAILKFEEEVIATTYLTLEAQISIKMQLVPKDQFLRKSTLSKQINELVRDIQARKPNKQLEWLFYLEKNTMLYSTDYPFTLELKYDLMNYPLALYTATMQLIDEWSRDRYILNYFSFIESYLSKLVVMMEQQTKTVGTINLQKLINLAFQWPLLEYVMQSTQDLVKKYSSNVIFEIKEVPKTKIDIKLEGYDSFLRFGPTKYYYHKGFVVIRLGVIFLQNNISSLMDPTYVKTKKLAIPDMTEYLQQIMNEDDLLRLQQFFPSDFIEQDPPAAKWKFEKKKMYGTNPKALEMSDKRVKCKFNGQSIIQIGPKLSEVTEETFAIYLDVRDTQGELQIGVMSSIDDEQNKAFLQEDGFTINLWNLDQNAKKNNFRMVSNQKLKLFIDKKQNALEIIDEETKQSVALTQVDTDGWIFIWLDSGEILLV